MIQRFALLFLWCFFSRSWTMPGDHNQNIFVDGRPYSLLVSTRSKCFSVIAPHDQIVFIEYDAPDLVIPGDTMMDATRRAKEADEFIDAKQDGEEGLDSQWNKRMKERMERIKSKKLRDTSITVSQKGATINSASNSKQNTSYDAAGKLVTSGSGRIREELSQKLGRIEFLTGKDSGIVEVCVQSILASPKKPARFHLRVEVAASDEDEHYDDDEEYDDDGHTVQEKEKTKDPDHLEHKELTTKMSRLERDLQTLQNRVKACLNNADFNKEQEVIFHDQSISMNRASKYWPIIQLTVLIVTGFTQANHIVRYLKSHHIGI